MGDTDNGRSGYYRTIARALLERRGAPFALSPRDQSAIASWEERRIPLAVVLEGVDRAFEGHRARGRPARSFTLSGCERQVDAAFAQHRDRAAGAGPAAAATGARRDKIDRARREIEAALPALAADDAEIAGLLREALGVLAAPGPDEDALERIDERIEAVLWARATEGDKAAAEAGLRRELRGARPGGPADLVRRQVVRAARDGRRIPRASLFYH